MMHSKLFILFTLTMVLAAALPAPAADRTVVPGTQGAVHVPFELETPSTVSVGLYTPRGQLVRIIAQGVKLSKGSHVALWDGMDLWGNIVSAGTELEARVFTHGGVKVYYEFAAGKGDGWDKSSPAWQTRPQGEGLRMRTGGWLGDHTGPGAAAAVGPKVFFGCRVAEYGHSMMATDLEGRKLWGGSPGGWGGPTELFPLGEEAVVGRMKGSLFRVDVDTYETTRLGSTGRYPIRAMAVHDGKVHLVLGNYKAEESPVKMSGRDIDWPQTVPQTLSGKSVEFQLSPKAAYAATFRGGDGHFQIGTGAKLESGEGHIVVPFSSPQEIGTIAIQGMKDVRKVLFYVLKKDLKYDQRKHSPFGQEEGSDSLSLDDAGGGGGLGGLGGGGLNMNPIEMNPNWVKVGESELPGRVNYVTLKKEAKTTALYVRFQLKDGKKRKRGPHISMCRLMTKRFEPVEATPRVLLPEGADGEATTRGRVGWKFRTIDPVSEIAPASVVIDYGKPVTFDVIAFLNQQNPRYTVYLYTGEGDPAEATEDDWKPVRSHRPRYSKKYRYLAARVNNNDTYFHLYRTATTRAIRLEYTDGYLGGKVTLGTSRSDPRRFECVDMKLLKMASKRIVPPTHVYQVRSAAEDKVLSETFVDDLEVERLGFADDGTCYTITDGRLCRSTPGEKSWKHEVLGDLMVGRASALSVYGDRLLIGDRGKNPAVYVTDRNGRVLHTIGGKGPFTIGKWDRDKVNRPVAVTMDRNGKAWIAENMYAPKRITRFNVDGRCEKEFIGNPEYGGGGWLDPDLSSFYYRGLEHKLDWEKGTSRLKAMNDRVYSEQTPTFEASSFGYTRGGRIVRTNGRKYAVGDPGGGFWIAIKEEHRWKPAAIVGPAKSVVLTRKEWKSHWLKQDLNGKGFIWTDQNGDGEYQVEEVQLFSFEQFGCNPAAGYLWGAKMGPDLTIWTTNGRWAPSGFNKHGAPIYELEKFQAFRYFEKLPRYTGMETFGSRAKPGPGSASVVTANGSWLLECQPYLLRKDMSFLGGTPEPKVQGYQPPIVGEPVHQPLSYAGSAETKSAVREVAVTNGNNGRWSITSVDDRILLDVVFTGSKGGWGSVPEQRGFDVTGYSHPSETFFGHFVKGDNGKYYCVVGKGFHAICRVEGLDDIRVRKTALKVTAESVEKNTQLRDVIVQQWKAWKLAMKRKLANREIYFPDSRDRLARLGQVDGFADEWGKLSKLHEIDEPFSPSDPPAKFFFDATYDDKGLYLVYRGSSPTGSSCEDPKYVFKKGFSVDFRYRASGGKDKDPVAGDRRIVFGPVKDKWTAVLYDYVDDDVPEEEHEKFVSPVVTTTVARVKALSGDEAKVVFKHSLNMDLSDAPASGGLLGERKTPTKAVTAEGEKAWVIEAFLPWKTLGFAEKPTSLKADVGVMVPDSGGLTVDKRKYWSNPAADRPVSDLGVEAQIQPSTWGVFHFKKKPDPNR